MIGVGILGAGFFGAFHARAIAKARGARLIAACAETEALAAPLASEHGARPYGDWRAMLENPAVDAVAITAPHHLHRPLAVAALEAGKHVLLEKPMALSVDECTEIIAASDRSGARLMIGQIMHFVHPCMVARDILDSDELGRPVTGSAALTKTWMETNRRGWHLETATGGGMLMTAGIHALDWLIWMMDSPVASVSAAVDTAFHDQDADDTAMLLLRFANGRFGQVASVGYGDGAGGFTLDLICERGTLRVDLARGVAVGRNGSWTEIAGSHDPDWMQNAVDREWQAFADAVNGNEQIPIPGLYGRHIIACIEAALRAGRERRDVAVLA